MEIAPLNFYAPMFLWKGFFDGMDQENSKTQGGKGQIRKFQKKQEGKNGGKERKKRHFSIRGGLHTQVFS
jgi:hypothetical protein